MVRDWKYKVLARVIGELRLCTDDQQNQVLEQLAPFMTANINAVPNPSYVGVNTEELTVRFERIGKVLDVLFPLTPKQTLKFIVSKAQQLPTISVNDSAKQVYENFKDQKKMLDIFVKELSL